MLIEHCSRDNRLSIARFDSKLRAPKQKAKQSAEKLKRMKIGNFEVQTNAFKLGTSLSSKFQPCNHIAQREKRIISYES